MDLRPATRFDAAPHRRMISLRFPRDEERLELLGELGDWTNPVLVRGEHRAELPCGVYAYKLRDAAGRWRLDPENPRTRSKGGVRNNVLCVGGAEEPVLFAPAAPFVTEADRGGLVVAAGLRHGEGETLRVRW